MPQVFIHLPKTAGTFVRQVLASRYAVVGCAYPSAPFQRLRDMGPRDIEALRRADVVIGHEGVHAFRLALGPDVAFSTVMRNPVDRLISYYNHLMSHSARYASAKVTPLKFIEEDSDHERDNLQLRYLSGKAVTDPVSEDDLHAAMAMIEQGSIVVGIQELLGESMRRMPIFKGVRIQEFPSVNVSTFGFSRRVPDEARDRRLSGKKRAGHAPLRLVPGPFPRRLTPVTGKGGCRKGPAWRSRRDDRTSVQPEAAHQHAPHRQ